MGKLWNWCYGVKRILDDFQSVDENNNKVAKPLRISKNGKLIGFVKKMARWK